jgi:hypothetical protein
MRKEKFYKKERTDAVDSKRMRNFRENQKVRGA